MIAIDKGFITPRQLLDALEIQIIENVEKGTHRPIGQILLEQGKMTVEQVEEILADIPAFFPDRA
jgi:hypothetical protein